MKDIEKALKSKSYIDSQSFVSEEYHNLINIFERQNINKLLSHQKNMISKLNWSQKRISILIFCTACYKKNCRYCNNIWINILQKISFSQIIFCLYFWYYLLKNWVKNYISALIIKFWMQLQFEIDIWFSSFKKYWINFQKHNISQNLTSLLLSIKFA